MVKMSAVVCNHSQVLDFGCTAYEQVKVLYFFASFPKPCSFFGKSMNNLVERDNIHFPHKFFNLLEIFLYPITIVSTKYKFSNNDVSYVADSFVYLIELFLNTAFSSKQENAGTSVKQVSVHSSTSKEFSVLAARISSMISSAERQSCHLPANRLAHPLRGLAVSSSGCVIEILSREISSSFSLSLKSFNSDQYFALTGEDALKIFVFIFSFGFVHAAKLRNNFETTNFVTKKLSLKRVHTFYTHFNFKIFDSFRKKGRNIWIITIFLVPLHLK